MNAIRACSLFATVQLPALSNIRTESEYRRKDVLLYPLEPIDHLAYTFRRYFGQSVGHRLRNFLSHYQLSERFRFLLNLLHSSCRLVALCKQSFQSSLLLSKEVNLLVSEFHHFFVLFLPPLIFRCILCPSFSASLAEGVDQIAKAENAQADKRQPFGPVHLRWGPFMVGINIDVTVILVGRIIEDEPSDS